MSLFKELHTFEKLLKSERLFIGKNIRTCLKQDSDAPVIAKWETSVIRT